MERKQIEQWENNYLKKCIGPQLQKSYTAEIKISGKSCKIDYCKIDNGNPSYPNDIVVLVPGFGSGWTGITLLGAELAKFGYTVLMPSLLGYGNSDNPPCYDKFDFTDEASYLFKWIEIVAPGKNIHLIGHSMSGAILTYIAACSPNTVASLSLLDPAGLNKRGLFELAFRFATNGMAHWFAFRNDPRWEILKTFLPQQKSPFAKDRLAQRISEGKRLCYDYALSALNKIQDKKRIRCFYGTKDTVCPYVINCEGILYVPLTGRYHNTTMYGSEITAQEIDGFIFNLTK